MAVLVSGVKGVEARTQTSPDANLIAVERPPILRSPSRVKGLENEIVILAEYLKRSDTRREGPNIVSHLGSDCQKKNRQDVKTTGTDFAYYYVDHDCPVEDKQSAVTNHSF